MRQQYRGFTIADWIDKTGIHWTRVANPMRPHQSLWAVRAHDIEAARSFIDNELNRQSQRKTHHRSEDIDGPPDDVLAACLYLGFKRPPTNPAAVKTAYKMLAVRFHPDKPEGSHEAMGMLNAARDILIAYIGTS